MSWSIGYDDNWKRDIGYGVPAFCDHPKCNAVIHRGLDYVCCDNEPYGGEKGCGLYFCGLHSNAPRNRCTRCRNYRLPFKPKPDHPEWITWKLKHASWARWRRENPDEVKQLKKALAT